MLEVKDCKTVWNSCLQVIKDNVGEQSFKTWFQPIVPLMLRENVLTIQVPSQFFYEWLEEHYVPLLRKAIVAELGDNGRLEYSVLVDKGGSEQKPYAIKVPTFNKNKQGQYNNQNNAPKEDVFSGSSNFETELNPRYTFDNYVEGDCNRLARSAGYAVAEKPGTTSFNPLMIYGGVGLGKTHLMQAIGNKIKSTEATKDKRILYVSSEKFANQFYEAVKGNNIQEFTNHYMKVDVLFIDDVQFLSGKEKTQEIFFHIFNHLHQMGKQIVMTSDRPPRELKGLEERLLSRFKWGLTADLQQPDFETRVAIIIQKMEADGLEIPGDVIEYLAYSIESNVREMEGVMISLIAQSSLNRKEIDLELAKQAIKNIVQNIETDVSLDFIQKMVSDFFHVGVEDLKDKTRKKEIVIARQVAMYFAKEYTNMSLKSIGFHFGKRDHSTVIHAITAVNDMLDVDRKFNNAIEELRKKLKVRSI